MSYKPPGLVQALRPGDVFIARQMDPTGNAGYTEDVYFCLWRRDHRPKDESSYMCSDDVPINYFIELGVLRWGRDVLETLMLERFSAIYFPWVPSWNVPQSIKSSLAR